MIILNEKCPVIPRVVYVDTIVFALQLYQFHTRFHIYIWYYPLLSIANLFSQFHVAHPTNEKLIKLLREAENKTNKE